MIQSNCVNIAWLLTFQMFWQLYQIIIVIRQPCQHRLSQATTHATNSGHHWQCMAREHPFEENYGASQTLWKRTVGNTKRRAHGLSLSPWTLANWFYSPWPLTQIVVTTAAVRSNGAAFLQLSKTSSGEGRWLKLRSRRIFYTVFATTADWLTPVLDLLRATRH